VADSAGGWVGKEEEVTYDRFVASDGWWSTGGRLATGAQAARPRNGSVRRGCGLGGGRGGAGKLGEPCGRAMVHSTRPIALEGGARAGQRCAAACAAGAAVWGPASSECGRGLGRRALQEELATDRGVDRDGGTARYDAVNAARVPRRSARRGVGGSRLETVARSRRDAEATR
jgi:hypothetical protein